MPIAATGPSPWLSLLPKERGAYVQLGLALSAGVVLGSGYPRAWGQALLTVLVFLLGGPVLALRGARVSTRAWALLALLGALALLPAVWVWGSAPLAQWRSLIIPTLLAAVLLGLALAQRAHTPLGELVAAWALSASAYPVAILGGAGPSAAGQLTLALVGMQSIGTLTVRGCLESLKQGGKWLPRAVPLGLGLGLAGLSFASGFPSRWTLVLALVPTTGIAAWMLMTPLAPRDLKQIGWLLTLAAATGIVPLLIALH